MTIKYEALQFLLDSGQILQVVVVYEESRQILNLWQAGKLDPMIGGMNDYGAWLVKVDKVNAIHAAPISAGQMPLLLDQTQKSVWRQGSSGL